MSIIIPKSNKELYDSPKSFKLIILLNTIGKLIKKVIGDRLQFHLISNNFIYSSQLGSLKQRSMSNVSVTLTHFIYSGWVKYKMTSTLAFDIAQLFSSLNHCLLSLILRKAGFNPKIECFFSNYLVGKKLGISEITFFLCFSMLTLEWSKALPSLLFYLLCI